MDFIKIWAEGLAIITGLMVILWGISIYYKNVSIVDIFWGLAYILVGSFYFSQTDGFLPRQIAVLSMVTLWGLRLSGYLGWRNYGQPEDIRYENFRTKYGENRYWWISFIQTFLVQAVTIGVVSLPILGAQFTAEKDSLSILDYSAMGVWGIGFIFEIIADIQLEKFRSKPDNYGKVLDDGLWKYSRHPNYFGDMLQWLGVGMVCAAGGSYIPLIGTLAIVLITLKTTGVLFPKKNVPYINLDYLFYSKRTSKLVPWPRKKLFDFNHVDENVG